MRNKIFFAGSILLMMLVALSSCSKHYTLGTVNFDYMPFIYQNDDNNQMEGICMDILEAIADVQNFSYDMEKLSIEETLVALKKGKIQASISPFTITEDKQVRYDFSIPLIETGIVFVSTQEKAKVSDISDLEGKSVAVLANSTMENYLNEYKEIWKVAQIITYETSDEVTEALFYDKVDLAFMEKPVIDYHISQGLMFETSNDVFNRSKFAYLFLKNENRDLYYDINVGLAKIINNGTYDKIISKYYL